CKRGQPDKSRHSRSRSDERNIFSVRKRDRTPANRIQFFPLQQMVPFDSDTPQMTPVDVIAVGVEKAGFTVVREGPVFNFAVSRGQQLWIAASSGDGVEMLPAILLTGKNNPILRGPADDSAARIAGHIRIGILRLLAAVPEFPSAPMGCVRYPNRPGMGAVR